VTVTRTLAHGRGSTLLSARSSLARAEAAQPKGTRMELRTTWHTVTVPGLGTLHPGAAAASLVNDAFAAGRLISGGHRMPLWPGDRQPAAYNPHTRVMTVRWMTASAFIDLILSVLAGASATALALALGAPAAVAAAIGAASAAAFVAAFLVDWILTATAVVTSPVKAAGGSALVAAAVAGGLLYLLLVRRRQEKRRSPREGD